MTCPCATGSAAPKGVAQAAGGAYGDLFSCVGAGGRGASLPWVAEAQAEYEMLQGLVDGARCVTLLQQHPGRPCALVRLVHSLSTPYITSGALGGAVRPPRIHILDCIQDVSIHQLCTCSSGLYVVENWDIFAGYGVSISH